jgi:hypothetical protein
MSEDNKYNLICEDEETYSCLPEDWELPDSWLEWALSHTKIHDKHITSTVDSFKNYNLGKKRKDWFVAWKNWCVEKCNHWAQLDKYDDSVSREHIGKLSTLIIKAADRKSYQERELRVKALEMANEIAIKINHFQTHYPSLEMFFDDMELIYKIADLNLKYILGEK